MGYLRAAIMFAVMFWLITAAIIGPGAFDAWQDLQVAAQNLGSMYQ